MPRNRRTLEEELVRLDATIEFDLIQVYSNSDTIALFRATQLRIYRGLLQGQVATETIMLDFMPFTVMPSCAFHHANVRECCQFHSQWPIQRGPWKSNDRYAAGPSC